MCFGKGSFLKEAAFNFRSFQLMIAFNDDIAHFHLLFLVNVDIKNDLILLGYVLTLSYFNICVFEPLVIKVFLCENFCTINHVGCNLSTFKNAELLLHIIALALL